MSPSPQSPMDLALSLAAAAAVAGEAPVGAVIRIRSAAHGSTNLQEIAAIEVDHRLFRLHAGLAHPPAAW